MVPHWGHEVDLVKQDGDGVEIAGEGVGPDAEGFERDGPTAGEGIDDERPAPGSAGEAIVGGLGGSAGGFEEDGIGGGFPRSEVGDEVEQEMAQALEVGGLGEVQRLAVEELPVSLPRVVVPQALE